MKLLFVCTGNTCRSPLAEAIARKVAIERGLPDVDVSSAGTSAWDGASASDGALLVGMERHLDLSGAPLASAQPRHRRRQRSDLHHGTAPPGARRGARRARQGVSPHRLSLARYDRSRDQRPDGRRSRRVPRHRRRARDGDPARLRPARRGARARRAREATRPDASCCSGIRSRIRSLLGSRTPRFAPRASRSCTRRSTWRRTRCATWSPRCAPRTPAGNVTIPHKEAFARVLHATASTRGAVCCRQHVLERGR